MQSHRGRSKVSLQVVFATYLLLVRCEGIAAETAPGDGDAVCGEMNDATNVRVLLDSWRYQTLLPRNMSTTNTAVWTTFSTPVGGNDVWTATNGVCESSAVTACPGGEGSKLLLTQAISKSLPAPDIYPVRIFVNVSYSYDGCPMQSPCTHDLKLQLGELSETPGVITLNGHVIKPDNRIHDPDGNEIQLYFDLAENVNTQFKLALVSQSTTACVTVSRVLVYRYECPGFELQSSGLVRRPATQAPVSGRVSGVSPHCAENSHQTQNSRPDLLACCDRGEWNSDGIVCECNFDYYRDGDVCKDRTYRPVTMPYNVNEDQGTVQVCFSSQSGTSGTFSIITSDKSAVGNFDYVPANKDVSFENQHLQCVNIQILSDTLGEEMETFSVHLMNGTLILSSTLVIISRSYGMMPCIEGNLTLVSDANNSSLQLVEMCSSEGVWSPACDHDWTLHDATVVCRELGYPSLGIDMMVLFSGGKSSKLGAECTGDETSLASCLEMYPYSQSCSYLRVDCSEELPLVVPSDPTGTVPPDTTPGNILPKETPITEVSNSPLPKPTGRVASTEEPSPEKGGVSVAVIAGVGGVAVALVTLVLVFCLVCAILLKRNHSSSKEGVAKFDRSSDLMCEGTSNGTTRGMSNGVNGSSVVTGSQEGEDKGRLLHNIMYTSPSSVRSNGTNGVKSSSATHKAPLHPASGITNTVYAIPTVHSLSPSKQEDTSLLQHTYDYALTTPFNSAPDYAVLEQTQHTYHYLERPDVVDVGGTQVGAVEEISGAYQTVGGSHAPGSGGELDHHYWTLEQN